jgi:hypothetical protein
MELHKKITGAVSDLLYLLERDYPRKSSIELVGNRYAMTSQDRMVLYRGVFRQKVCECRIGKRWSGESASFKRCVIDGYNVFITIESYLKGRLVFRALDGYIRDVAGVYGSYTFNDMTPRAAKLVMSALKQHLRGLSQVVFYLDYPVSKSGEFAAFLRETSKRAGIDALVDVVKSPDSLIASRHANDVIATSDSVLIDAVGCCVDIPALVFSGIMGKTVPDLGLLMREHRQRLERLQG